MGDAASGRGHVAYPPCSAEDIFKDYRARSSAILRALTHDKENLCLYGYADEAWEVALPAEEVPTELPEPALGMNFARDLIRLNRNDRKSYYDVRQVPKGAAEDQIKRSYRKLALKYHHLRPTKVPISGQLLPTQARPTCFLRICTCSSTKQ